MWLPSSQASRLSRRLVSDDSNTLYEVTLLLTNRYGSRLRSRKTPLVQGVMRSVPTG